jgi:hypothetical protein
VSLASGRGDAEIILVNVQSRETLDASEIAAVISGDADRAADARLSKKALRRAIGLCRKAPVNLETRSGPVAAPDLLAQLSADLACLAPGP